MFTNCEKKSSSVLFWDEDDDKIHDAEEEKDHDYKPRGLTNTITITTFSWTELKFNLTTYTITRYSIDT